MLNKLKKLKRALSNKETRGYLLRKLNPTSLFVLSIYLHGYYHKKLQQDIAVFEGEEGGLLPEWMQSNVSTYPKVYISFEDGWKEKIKEQCKEYNLGSIHFVKRGSLAYYRVLAMAKTVYYQSKLGSSFVPKEGQILHTIQGKAHKKRLLFYAGGFEKNGITTSLCSLLSNVDLSDYTVTVAVETWKIKDPEFLQSMLPQGIQIQYLDNLEFSIKEEINRFLYYRMKYSNGSVKASLDRGYVRQFTKYFRENPQDLYIQFTGYDSDWIHILQQAPANRLIYVHNDMVQEIKTKGYQHYETLHEAYGAYDYVIPVTEDILPATKSINPNGNYVVVNNCFDYKSVIEKAKQQLVFDEDTISTHTLEQVKAILNGDAAIFITIGRFSAEKGHKLLIEAFATYRKTNPNTYLIIIGGYGTMYEQTKEYVRQMREEEHSIIIKSMKNPMPILANSDLFLLSSLYEGLGLTILEADALHIPVISTDILGPRGFMRQHGGCLVAPTVEGILQGMYKFSEGKINGMSVDYQTYNELACQEFFNIIHSVK